MGSTKDHQYKYTPILVLVVFGPTIKSKNNSCGSSTKDYQYKYTPILVLVVFGSTIQSKTAAVEVPFHRCCSLIR